MNFLNTLIFLFFLQVAYTQNEAWYIDHLNQHFFNGRTEVTCTNGRVDIVTDVNAIEVEMAQKWKHAIGQSLWYAIQMDKRPGIVLIMKDLSERKYGIMLQSTLDHAGLSDQIDIWFYPEDFVHSSDAERAIKKATNNQLNHVPSTSSLSTQHTLNDINSSKKYSLNKSSQVRHNHRCTYYNCKNCVASDASKGKACNKCGG